MSRLDEAFQNDVKALEHLHDELKVHAHLLKAEAKKHWDELETKWAGLKEQLQRAEAAADRRKGDVEAAARLLVQSLKSGFTDVRNALKD
jgi:hypothetical protein